MKDIRNRVACVSCNNRNFAKTRQIYSALGYPKIVTVNKYFFIEDSDTKGI